MEVKRRVFKYRAAFGAWWAFVGQGSDGGGEPRGLYEQSTDCRTHDLCKMDPLINWGLQLTPIQKEVAVSYYRYLSGISGRAAAR